MSEMLVRVDENDNQIWNRRESKMSSNRWSAS